MIGSTQNGSAGMAYDERPEVKFPTRRKAGLDKARRVDDI